MTDGLDPSKIGSALHSRAVIYARNGCGVYSGKQVNDLVDWEDRYGDHSRPAIWVQEDADPEHPDDTPELDRVSRLIRKGRVHQLVVWRLDRLAKPTSRAAHYIDTIVNKHGCHFVSVDDQIDTSLPSGRLFMHQLNSLLMHPRECKRLGISRRGSHRGVKPTGPHKHTLRLAPKAQRLLDQGYTKYETAKRLSISRGLLDSMINEHGLVTYNKGG